MLSKLKQGKLYTCNLSFCKRRKMCTFYIENWMLSSWKFTTMCSLNNIVAFVLYLLVAHKWKVIVGLSFFDRRVNPGKTSVRDSKQITIHAAENTDTVCMWNKIQKLFVCRVRICVIWLSIRLVYENSWRHNSLAHWQHDDGCLPFNFRGFYVS